MDRPPELEPTSAPDLPPWPIPIDVEDMAYLGVCRKCHHITFISVEGRDHLDSLGEDIKQLIIEGDRYIVYRPIDEAKELIQDWWGRCNCYKSPEQASLGL